MLETVQTCWKLSRNIKNLKY